MYLFVSPVLAYMFLQLKYASAAKSKMARQAVRVMIIVLTGCR
jgi:hypothetical protein